MIIYLSKRELVTSAFYVNFIYVIAIFLSLGQISSAEYRTTKQSILIDLCDWIAVSPQRHRKLNIHLP